MKVPKYALGIDVSSKTFTVTLSEKPGIGLYPAKDYDNIMDGFDTLTHDLKAYNIKRNDVIICMESTGVYGEHICHYLYNQGYNISVEQALKVKRAFDPEGHKTDAVDSLHIAEYALRYYDKLQAWKPREAIVEKVASLLSARELLVKHRSAFKNARTSMNRKITKTELVLGTLNQSIKTLDKGVNKLEKEIKRLIDSNPIIRQSVNIVKSAPGLSELTASYFIVLTNGFTNIRTGREMAAYLHIAPYMFQSGSSVRRKTRSPKYGPSSLPSRLHLGARSVAYHNKTFKKYFLQKLAQGKAKYLIYNNISNKIVSIVAAMLRENKPYDDKYVSINPSLLK
jgi:transposase